MSISELNSSTFPLEIAESGQISSNKLNKFSEAVAVDLASVSSMWNQKIIPILNSLPADYDPETDYFDGSAIYVDHEAATDKDFGAFYYNDSGTPANSRPLTIKEGMLAILHLIANTENSLREGIAIASYSSQMTLAGGDTVSYSWPFSNYIFEHLIFEESGSTISVSPNIEVTADSVSSQITIENTSGSSINIWGYIWHPVFNF